MTKTYKICTLPGDGIGPEIMAEGVKVLKALGEKYDVDFACEDALIGGCAIDATGEALPQATLDAANVSDAVLLAAVGGPKWDTTDPSMPRPEQGLLGIRKALGLYTNLRPVQIFNALAEASTLKPEVIDGVDMMIVRELTGGILVSASVSTTKRAQAPMANLASAHTIRLSIVNMRLSALPVRHSRLPASAARRLPASTRLTFWRPAACGAKSFIELAQKNIPMFSSKICW